MASCLITFCRRFPQKHAQIRVLASQNLLQFTRSKHWDKHLKDDMWLKDEQAKTFAEIKEELEYQDPAVYEAVDISLPTETKQFKRKGERLKFLQQIKNDKTLEQAARHRKLHIALDEVKKDWHSENWSRHVHSIAEHYRIYQDLFGHAYFYPRVQMEISYDYDEELVTPVHRGNHVLPSEASEVPHVHYEAADDTLWTLVMTSPDEQLHDQEKEYLHWFIGNIPGSEVSKGEVLCNYLPPIPPQGTGHHRYVFILYKQDQRMDYGQERRPENCTSLRERTFSSYEFYKEHQDYITPAGLAFFQSEYDESVQGVFHNVLNMKEPSFEYDYPTDYHPAQKRFPHKQPFNLYLERYRDTKEIAEDVLKERLAMISPFEEPPKQPKYPNAFFISDKPSWYKIQEQHKRNREGKYKDLPK